MLSIGPFWRVRNTVRQVWHLADTDHGAALCGSKPTIGRTGGVWGMAIAPGDTAADMVCGACAEAGVLMWAAQSRVNHSCETGIPPRAARQRGARGR